MLNCYWRITNRFLFSQTAFEFFQRFGIHVTRKHFYSPIPDTEQIKRKSDIWENETELVGIDLNVERQIHLLEKVFRGFQNEWDFPVERTSTPHEYYINNDSFGYISAATYYSMIRYLRPRTIIEVGSGNSTYVAAKACLKNLDEGNKANLISIEPNPNNVLKKGFPGLTKLITSQVEDIGIQTFDRLRDHDILFIDSSHVSRIGGDVNFLYLEVLPRLRKGVTVHIHDVFFPGQYPKNWVIQLRLFWTEQYILQAFLIFNKLFEILWCGSYIYQKYLDKVLEVFPPPEGLEGGRNYFSSSFWMRKVG